MRSLQGLLHARQWSKILPFGSGAALTPETNRNPASNASSLPAPTNSYGSAPRKTTRTLLALRARGMQASTELG